MSSFAACECGAEEQTVDHVVLQCPIHRPPHGLHGLTVLNDETTEWLLNTCPEISRSQAVDKRTPRSNERRSDERELPTKQEMVPHSYRLYNRCSFFLHTGLISFYFGESS